MAWALLAASSLLVGALVAFAVPIPRRVLGLIMGFGAGVLISAVAYELILEAVEVPADRFAVAAGFAAGALVFYAGDVAIDRRTAGWGDGGGLALVLGAVLDGIPESVVIGISLVAGEGASVAVIVAVFLSNVPEAISATSDLLSGGWSKGKVLAMWGLVVLASGLGLVGRGDPGVRGGVDPDDARRRDDPRSVRVHRAQQDGWPDARAWVRGLGRAVVHDLTQDREETSAGLRIRTRYGILPACSNVPSGSSGSSKLGQGARWCGSWGGGERGKQSFSQ